MKEVDEPLVAPFEYDHFVGGAKRSRAGAGRIERRHPATGEVVATYARGDASDVAAAVGAAAKALESWRETTQAHRSTLLLRAADAIEAEETRLAATLSREVGKPIHEALAEVRDGVALWRYAAAALRAIHGEFHPSLAPGTEGFTILEPVGVVGLIVPWNFPFIVSAERLPFILAAGCTVVVKPSEYASANAIEIGGILKSAGFADGVYNVVTGYGHEAGVALVEAPDVAMISFTGSTENGRRVMELASRTLKRVSLELGGKSPVVIFADAPMERAVEGVISGFTYNAGQCCIATSRLLLERSAADRFKPLLLARLKKMSAATPQPSATEAQYERVAKYVEAGKNESTLLFGGAADGHAVTPSVFDDVKPGSPMSRDEIFGPVLSIHYFDTEEEAIALANDTVYGLAACVWSGDVPRALRVARRIHAGRLWVNSPQENFPEMPVGGMRASGMGREAGSAGIRTYSDVKSVIMKSWDR